MTDIADLDALTAPASGDLFHVIDVSETAARQDKKITRQYLLGYTEYVALLTQSGTDAPTATVVKNDTGATVALARVLAGYYSLTFSSAVLTANKTVAVLQSVGYTTNTAIFVNSTTVIYISTADNAYTLADSLLAANPVIIRIYT